MLFTMRQNWWVQRYGVFVSMPNFTLQKREGCLNSVVEKAIMKMQKKTERHTRGLAAQFIDFLDALKYQHINQTLEWYLLFCFYPRIGNFRKKFWKRSEKLFQKNIYRDKKAAYYFLKASLKIILQKSIDKPEMLLMSSWKLCESTTNEWKLNCT